MSRNDDLKARGQEVLVGNYKQQPLALVRGAGCEVFDADGRRYLDMVGGIATCALGHCHPRVVEALTRQAQALWHVTNGYYIEPQIELAERLTRASGLDRAFFCNSGGEANEAALKLVRKHHHDAGQSGRYEVICAQGSFHGRTLATTAATGQGKHQKGFAPLPEGFAHVPYGDLDAVERAVGGHTAAVLMEPVQGEGGVNLPPPGYLKGLRAICDRHGLLLVLDEVQSGMGRTGKWFAFQHEEGVRPDVITLAKAMGNGMPLGAMLCTDAASRALTPGSHGSTFGGNPLATAVGVAVFDTLASEGLIERCRAMGEALLARLREKLLPLAPGVVDVRGKGLLLGVELAFESAKVVARARERGVLFNAVADKVVRLAPAFIVTPAQLDEAVLALAWAVAEEAKARPSQV